MAESTIDDYEWKLIPDAKPTIDVAEKNAPMAACAGRIPASENGMAAMTTAAAARNWNASEDLHRQALEHVDRLPFPIAQPNTREWYARMLTERAEPGDTARARELLGEAVAEYEAMGMVASAGRATKLREAISGV